MNSLLLWILLTTALVLWQETPPAEDFFHITLLSIVVPAVFRWLARERGRCCGPVASCLLCLAFFSWCLCCWQSVLSVGVHLG